MARSYRFVHMNLHHLFQKLSQKIRHCLPRAARGQALPNDGARAEAQAETYLRAQGVKVIARNVRCKGGEIDLIAEQGNTVLIVEVRLRQHGDYGGAAASITSHKQQRIQRATRWWLQGAGQRYSSRPLRFDALLLTSLDGKIEWLQGAFSAH